MSSFFKSLVAHRYPEDNVCTHTGSGVKAKSVCGIRLYLRVLKLLPHKEHSEISSASYVALNVL